MMTRRGHATLVWIVWLMAMAAAPPVEAGPLRKLGRGIGNVAAGWIEIPAQVAWTTEVHGSIAGLSVGVVKGAAFAVGRTIVGAVETATFFLPNHPRQVGGDSYGPLIEPEFPVLRNVDSF